MWGRWWRFWQRSRARSVRSARASQRRPTFKAGVELIYVNVVVRDGSGNIVRNLKKEDFTLVEDDKSQTITAFDFEEVPSEAIPATEPAAPVQPILKAEAAIKPAAPASADVAAVVRSEAGADRLEESPADRAAVRFELDAARGARAGNRVGLRLHRQAADAGRSRRDRVGGFDAADCSGLHRRPRDADRGARSLLRRRYCRVPGRHDAHRRGNRGRRVRRRRQRVQHLQHRSAPGRHRAAVGYPGADPAEEVDRVLQQRRDAARRRQPGAASRGDRPGRESQRLHLSRRHARIDGDRAGRRREPGEWTRRLVHVFGTRRVAAVRQPGCQSGHARRAGERHRRQGVPRYERFRRRLHEGHRRHVGLLPARLLQHQPGTRRPLQADPGTAQQVGPEGGSPQRLLRNPRFPALGQGGSRAAAAGPVDDGSFVNRPDRLDVDVVLPVVGRSFLRAGVDCRAGIGDPVRAVEHAGQGNNRRHRSDA